MKIKAVRIATRKDPKLGAAVYVEIVDQPTITITHSELTTHDTAEKLKAEAERQANATLGEVFFHFNRDGTVAVALGREPTIWPEDDMVEIHG